MGNEAAAGGVYGRTNSGGEHKYRVASRIFLSASVVVSAVIVAMLAMASAAAASGIQSSQIDTPFADDPKHVVAYRPVSIDYHSQPIQDWHVYSCDTPENGPVGSDRAAISGWGSKVAAWFSWASEGRYRPRFEASGHLTGDSRLDCAEQAGDRMTAAERAARTGVIILHDEYEGGQGAAYGLSATTQWSTDGNEIAIDSDARPPQVTLTGDRIAEPWRWALVVHEMGHTMGWAHVGFQGGSDYGNYNDVMGGIQGVGTSVFNRYRSGWLDPAQVAIHSGGTSIHHVGAVGSSGTQMVVIPTEEVGVLYVIGARKDDSFDTPESAGIEVHRVDQSLDDAESGRCASWEGRGACLGYGVEVEALPPPGTSDYEYGAWQVGQTLAVAGVSIEVADADADGFVVRLTGSAAPMWSATAASSDPTYEPPPARAQAPREEAPLAPATLISSGHPFADVPPDHPMAASITWLADAGVTKGCNPPDNDLFCPDAPVTRGQMAAFLNRVLVLPSGSPDSFVDSSGSVFGVDIGAIASAGITRGCNPPDNDRFCPEAPVTRGQMAAFLTRAFDMETDKSVSFLDTDGHVFEADISGLASSGVTKGCNPPTNDLFCPGRALSRAEMAVFLHRILG